MQASSLLNRDHCLHATGRNAGFQAHTAIVVYPQIVSTDLDVLIYKAIDGPPASADDLVGLDVRHIFVAELDTSGLENIDYSGRSLNNTLDDLRGLGALHCNPLVLVRIVLTCLDHSSTLRENIEGIKVGVQIKNSIPRDPPPVDGRGISGCPY
jgi:hypothetical protein